MADLYNHRYRRGLPQYRRKRGHLARGRAGLTRIAAGLGNIHLGHLLPDYTAYEELDVFRASFQPIVLDASDGFRLQPQRLEKEIVGAGLGLLLLSNPCNPTDT